MIHSLLAGGVVLVLKDWRRLLRTVLPTRLPINPKVCEMPALHRDSVELGIRDLLILIGEDPDREGLRETPNRFINAITEMTGGRWEDPAQYVKTFEDGACDELVALVDMPLTSICEHHLMPFMGIASIGYIPDRRVIGISKLGRILQCFARRLQIQEKLTQQVTNFLMENLQPLGAACVIKATHTCMICRGAYQSGTMITSSLQGVFRTEAEARAEFLELIKRGR